MTQKEKVIQYMTDNGSITPLDAYREFGIMRLAAVVFDLKEQGYPIETTIKAMKNRYGDKVRFAEYCFKEGKE